MEDRRVTCDVKEADPASGKLARCWSTATHSITIPGTPLPWRFLSCDDHAQEARALGLEAGLIVEREER